MILKILNLDRKNVKYINILDRLMRFKFIYRLRRK